MLIAVSFLLKSVRYKFLYVKVMKTNRILKELWVRVRENWHLLCQPNPFHHHHPENQFKIPSKFGDDLDYRQEHIYNCILLTEQCGLHDELKHLKKEDLKFDKENN